MPDGYYAHHYQGFVVQFPGCDILSVKAVTCDPGAWPPPLASAEGVLSPLWKWPDLALFSLSLSALCVCVCFGHFLCFCFRNIY